jgi:hypothetical protein
MSAVEALLAARFESRGGDPMKATTPSPMRESRIVARPAVTTMTPRLSNATEPAALRCARLT